MRSAAFREDAFTRYLCAERLSTVCLHNADNCPGEPAESNHVHVGGAHLEKMQTAQQHGRKSLRVDGTAT